MCVEPFLIFEQRAKQQRNLPMMISFGTGRKRTGMAQNVAPMAATNSPLSHRVMPMRS
jgi:hypothetical protein